MAAGNVNRAAGDGAPNRQLHFVGRLASVPLVAGVFDVVSQRYAAIKARSLLLSAALSASENMAATAVGCCGHVLRARLGPQLEHADALACRGIERLEQRCPAVLRRPEEVAADVVAFGRQKVLQVQRCGHEQVERTRRVIGHAVHAATHPAAVVERVRDHVSQRLHRAFNEVDEILNLWISAHDPAHDVARNNLAVSHTFSELAFIALHKFRNAAALQFACERAAVEHISWAAYERFQRCLHKTPSRSQLAQIFYTMLIVTGICHVNSALHSPVGFTLILLLLSFSGLCVIFSGVLLLGLYLDNRLLLIPWLAIVSMTTLLDIVLSLYFIADLKVDGFVVAMYVVDYTLCSVNIYCIMCVLSQYQEYAVGRRALGCQTSRVPLPVVSAYNSSSSSRRAGGGRSMFSRIASWPSRRICRKAALPQGGSVRPPSCSITIPADAGAAEAAAATAGAGKVTNGVTRIARENLLMPEPPHGYSSTDDVSSGLHLSTAETSLQPSGEEVDLPENVCTTVFNSGTDNEQLEEVNSKLRTQCKTTTETGQDKEFSAEPASPVLDNHPLLDASSSPDMICKESKCNDNI
ncbi:uncharacterized protein LOC142578878 [Dermacentor variabilis]|uniref:uncharacterized protein LOC142578878 n=1 Tax=Dermacentor variabilis TaxID=34621 RepID=UPI003F5C719F